MFYNTDSISKDEIHITSTTFGKSGSYSSICRAICTGHNNYTCPRIVKRAIVTPIQINVLKNDTNFHDKINSFNSITQIFY